MILFLNVYFKYYQEYLILLKQEQLKLFKKKQKKRIENNITYNNFK